MKIKSAPEKINRVLIYQYILNNPGVHFRELSRKLNIKIYNLKYHIKILNKKGVITQKKEDGYLRLYVPNKISNNDKIVFSFLRKKTTRNIIIIILYNIAASQREICEILQKSSSTINVHIKNLLKKNIIEIAPTNKGIVNRKNKPKTLKKDLTGREVVYRLTDATNIYRILNEYRETLLDRETKIILDGINIFVKNGIVKSKSGFFGTDSYDPLIKEFYEIFPNPYHV